MSRATRPASMRVFPPQRRAETRPDGPETAPPGASTSNNTPMRPTDAHDQFETELSYPVDRQTVIETVGDRSVESPDGGEESVASILERTEETTFYSSQDLFETFRANLGDQHIGEKFYDDRGPNIDSDHSRTDVESDHSKTL